MMLKKAMDDGLKIVCMATSTLDFGKKVSLLDLVLPSGKMGWNNKVTSVT